MQEGVRRYVQRVDPQSAPALRRPYAYSPPPGPKFRRLCGGQRPCGSFENQEKEIKVKNKAVSRRQHVGCKQRLKSRPRTPAGRWPYFLLRKSAPLGLPDVIKRNGMALPYCSFQFVQKLKFIFSGDMRVGKKSLLLPKCAPLGRAQGDSRVIFSEFRKIQRKLPARSPCWKKPVRAVSNSLKGRYGLPYRPFHITRSSRPSMPSCARSGPGWPCGCAGSWA